MEKQTVTVSSKGQIVIPAMVRKEFDLKPGDKIVFTRENNQVTLKKAPTASEWKNVLKNIPIKDTPMNKDKTAIQIKKDSDDSDFVDWIING